MGVRLSIPHHSYDQLRRFAAGFLAKYNSVGTIPVPIEEIAENPLGLDIIPIPGLKRSFEIDGFIDSDLSAITVDQFVLENRVARYRFTLAHEIAHLHLHRAIFKQVKFRSIDEWKKFQLEVDPKDSSWLEWQANVFAGLVLVPPLPLKEQFEVCEASVRGEGFPDRSEATLLYIAERLSGIFEVSRGVIERRIAKDNLFRPDT